MIDLKMLSNIELIEINGGYDNVSSGYPGQSLVNFIWTTLKGAYQKGYDDKVLNLEPCMDLY